MRKIKMTPSEALPIKPNYQVSMSELLNDADFKEASEVALHKLVNELVGWSLDHANFWLTLSDADQVPPKFILSLTLPEAASAIADQDGVWPAYDVDLREVLLDDELVERSVLIKELREIADLLEAKGAQA